MECDCHESHSQATAGESRSKVQVDIKMPPCLCKGVWKCGSLADKYSPWSRGRSDREGNL